MVTVLLGKWGDFLQALLRLCVPIFPIFAGFILLSQAQEFQGMALVLSPSASALN